MSFDEVVIRASGLGKVYQLYDRPADRLKQFLWRGRKQFYREFWALREVNLEVRRGEVIGIVGRNGAGKSTLLQILCGTLSPSHGEINVKGRVAALLELGAGFNPEFTGRENVLLNATILGLSETEIKARYDEIVAFSGIGDFIDQPVKTYSSGMFVRLAFSIATSVDPDILIIDEALSVGDGEFARKSFERIMELKEAGKTILFCSHSLYQIEALCNRAVWIDHGHSRAEGPVSEVIVAYDAFLSNSHKSEPDASSQHLSKAPSYQKGTAKLQRIEVCMDGACGKKLQGMSGQNQLAVDVAFTSDPTLPVPSVAVCITAQDGRMVSSAGTRNDDVVLSREADGRTAVRLLIPNLPLLKGNYDIHVYLMCERAIHTYDMANIVSTLQMGQTGLEIGVVTLPHSWAKLP